MGDRIVVMKDGLLQQVGTPRELHDSPVNLFVAGFIGAPAMNFFPARATTRAADTGFANVPLNGHADRIAGREVIVGVRPEDVHDLARSDPDGKLPVDAKVEVVEYLGNELQLHLNASGSAFVARVSTDTQTTPGATLRVGFDMRRIHFFDAATEEAIR